MANETNQDSDLLLRLENESEDDFSDSSLSVMSALETMELSKHRKLTAPIYLQIAEEVPSFNNGKGFFMTLEQSKKLIETLQQAIDFLEA